MSMSTESGRRWRLTNPEKMKAARKRWAGANKERERVKKAGRDKRYYERHKHKRDKEKIAERAREDYARNPERRLAASIKWKSANKESILKYAFKYYREHKDEIQAKPKPWNSPERQRERRARRIDYYREWMRTYRQKNKILYATYSQNRRARKSGGDLTADQVEQLFDKVGYRCANCSKKKKLTIDHIVPLSRGGEHSIRNIQFLCLSCNSSKNASDPIDFARRMGRLV